MADLKSLVESFKTTYAAPVKHKHLLNPEDMFDAKCPEGAKLWDYEKNAPHLPGHFGAQSNSSFWFQCPKHGSWKAKIQSITMGQRCKACYLDEISVSKRLRDTFKKLAKDNALDTIFKFDARFTVSKSPKKTFRLDMLIPHKRIAIMVDELNNFDNKKEELILKNQELINNGFKVIRIRDDRLFPLASKKTNNYWEIQFNKEENFQDVFENLLDLMANEMKQEG